MDLLHSFEDFKTQIFANPAPWFGGIIGGLVTGGLFGWINYIRNIKPVIIFHRDADEAQPRWKIRNIGPGAAINIRIRDYDAKGGIDNRVHCYPLCANEKRSIAWVTGGEVLEVDYTDVY